MQCGDKSSVKHDYGLSARPQNSFRASRTQPICFVLFSAFYSRIVDAEQRTDPKRTARVTVSHGDLAFRHLLSTYYRPTKLDRYSDP